MKHFLSLDQISSEDLNQILNLSAKLKSERGRHSDQPLSGQTWALMFSKSSTRTRVSFEVGIRELGGHVIFLAANDMQLGRGEPIKDTGRVLGRMVHGAVIRTYAHSDILEFAEFSKIPTINALTDHSHPCQIMADLLTIRENLGSEKGKTIAFFGDGACNVPTSWINAANKFDFELRIAAPPEFQPDKALLDGAQGRITVTNDPQQAAAGADVLYTDVWVSMGKEAESDDRLKILKDYQINAETVDRANKGALVMHCLPAYRGKEISEAVLEEHATTIFNQAENRLHTQKAILHWLVS